MRKISKSFSILIIIFGLYGCSAFSAKSKFSYLKSSAYGHLGKGVGIPFYEVDGTWMSSVSGWGGGGAFNCCVKVPRYPNPNKPYFVNVVWETCDIRYIKFIDGVIVDKNQQCISEIHEKKVLVNFAVEPRFSGGIIFHFLPGNNVEAWVTDYYPGSEKYRGPKPPWGPAPDYT